MAEELREEDAFADAEDLRAWCPDMPPGSDEHAQKLLHAASQFIVNANDGEVPDAAAITLEQITCNIVRRAMQAAAADHSGMSQVQIGAGPYSGGGTVANPHGDFYLTKAEKQQLGIGGQRGYEIDLLAGSQAAYEEARRDPRGDS